MTLARGTLEGMLPLVVKAGDGHGAFRVTVVEGPDAGRAATTSDAGELTIGSSPANDLVLGDPSVSPHHCVIAPSCAGTVLRDLGSQEGTYAAGLRVESVLLETTAELRVGRDVLRFRHLRDEARAGDGCDAPRFGGLISTSPAMRRLFGLLPRLATADTTILLEGETGTGKTALAKTLHEASHRREKPFIVVDCASMPPSLIESELFGHTRGAFTGATAARPGAFEAATGGTLFLDEVGELPRELQPKLLRVLEERVVQRVGSTQPTRVDVRIVAATNRDLRREVNRGTFRLDLFHRLNVVRLHVPPLRERPADVVYLARHYYRHFVGDAAAELPVELERRVLDHDWPGNVRELRNFVERAVVLGDPLLWQVCAADEPARRRTAAAEVLAEDEPATDGGETYSASKERYLARWERRYVERLLALHAGNISRAARAAGMDRTHLRRLMHKRGVTGHDEG